MIIQERWGDGETRGRGDTETRRHGEGKNNLLTFAYYLFPVTNMPNGRLSPTQITNL
ncbi:hypothetical protein [Trichormus sp. NMC-1]|uniref:hypothetical protein n=1 Tax=Trichormus sp. NMC-1 TaxID=1853259 RepID=UPI0015A63195|nr:hypothetical protein [Trichormus sp. NMC-1]